jgi:hypothetical protein
MIAFSRIFIHGGRASKGLLIDAFWEVFAEGKKSLERDPARFAHETLTSWCLGADGASRVLFEVENHYDWRDLLRDLEHATRSEIFPEDFGYRPVPKLCLATMSTLPARSPKTRPMLSQMHPYLTLAVTAVLAGDGCASVEEAVDRFPVLKGLTNDELIRLRGNRGISVGTAALDLLCPRLPLHQRSTVDRFYRPKEFLPR